MPWQGKRVSWHTDELAIESIPAAAFRMASHLIPLIGKKTQDTMIDRFDARATERCALFEGDQVRLTGAPVQIAGVGGVPAGAGIAVVALTVVTGASATSLFAYPCAEGHQSGSVVAAQANRVSTVVVPVRLSAGQLCVKSIHPADVVVDVVGAG